MLGLPLQREERGVLGQLGWPAAEGVEGEHGLALGWHGLELICGLEGDRERVAGLLGQGEGGRERFPFLFCFLLFQRQFQTIFKCI